MGDLVFSEETFDMSLPFERSDSLMSVILKNIEDPLKQSIVPKFKVGDILTLPLNAKAEAVKVTEDYIIFDVPNRDPIKLYTKDIKFFQNLEQ